MIVGAQDSVPLWEVESLVGLPPIRFSADKDALQFGCRTRSDSCAQLKRGNLLVSEVRSVAWLLRYRGGPRSPPPSSGNAFCAGNQTAEQP